MTYYKSFYIILTWGVGPTRFPLVHYRHDFLPHAEAGLPYEACQQSLEHLNSGKGDHFNLNNLYNKNVLAAQIHSILNLF